MHSVKAVDVRDPGSDGNWSPRAGLRGFPGASGDTTALGRSSCGPAPEAARASSRCLCSAGGDTAAPGHPRGRGWERAFGGEWALTFGFFRRDSDSDDW